MLFWHGHQMASGMGSIPVDHIVLPVGPGLGERLPPTLGTTGIGCNPARHGLCYRCAEHLIKAGQALEPAGLTGAIPGVLQGAGCHRRQTGRQEKAEESLRQSSVLRVFHTSVT